MAAKNEKKKLTFEDKFARHFYCQHARLNSIHQEKKMCTLNMKKKKKKICRESLDNRD